MRSRTSSERGGPAATAAPSVAAHLRAGVEVGLGTAVLDAAVWAAARAAGADLLVPGPGGAAPEPVGLAAVVVFSVLPLVVASVVLRMLATRSGDRTARRWTLLAAGVTVVSFAPLAQPGIGVGTVVALGAMHLVAGAAAIVVLPRRVAAVVG